MNLLCYPLCLSGIEKTWMKCLIAGSRSLFRTTQRFIGAFKQLSKNQCNTAWLFFKKHFFFFTYAGFLDLKEIKLKSNPIWMTGTMWFKPTSQFKCFALYYLIISALFCMYVHIFWFIAIYCSIEIIEYYQHSAQPDLIWGLLVSTLCKRHLKSHSYFHKRSSY